MNSPLHDAHPLPIGVIGLGGAAQMMHLPYLNRNRDRFTLAALADADSDTLAAVGDHYGIAPEHRYTHAHALLDALAASRTGGAHAAVLIAHSGSHTASVLAALERGLHVFCEKPLAWGVREAETVAAMAAQADRIVQVGYHKLYDPGLAEAKAAIAAMRDLAFVRVTVLHPADGLGWAQHRVLRGRRIVQGWREPGTLAEEAHAQRMSLAEGALAGAVDEALAAVGGASARTANPRLRLAYGLMTVSLIHQTYTLDGLFGHVPARVLHTDVWREGLSLHITGELRDGVPLTIDWHFLSHLKDYREEYAVFGNHDRVYFTLPSPYALHAPSPVTVQGHEGEKTWEKRIIVSHEEAFERELLAFHARVMGRSPDDAPVSPADAVRHHRFIQAMIDAAG
jgi:predicted dehydrogenase